MQEVTIEKLVHGGQGIGTLPDGRKVFVWGALPGETVSIQLAKSRKSFAEGEVIEVVKLSPERVEPKEPKSYMSTSPWQILSYEAENEYKKGIVVETFEREGVPLPGFTFKFPDKEYHYRNKMEYSFYGNENGVHLALFNRGSHQKQIVNGSALAMPAIDAAAKSLLAEINRHGVRAGDLKSLILRCTREGKTAAALFVKSENLPVLTLPGGLQGMSVAYSNPKSPASVVTKELYTIHDIKIADTLEGKNIMYDVFSFFQVNLPIFGEALRSIAAQIGRQPDIVDFYSGVGGLGIATSHNSVTLVESDAKSAEMARINLANSGLKGSVVEASAEKSLEQIRAGAPLIADPPRAGLHKDVTDKILSVRPPVVAYLSCNPITQARDLKLLMKSYAISFFEGYNFFPRTPHIESLAVLKRK